MTIWLVAALCLGLLAAEGYYQGAIRATISLLGLFFALALAIPVSPVVDFIFPILGFEHPLVPRFVGPIIAFFLVAGAFKIGAEVAHRKAEYHFKYHAPDAVRMVWQKLNRKLGVSVGVVSGSIYTLAVCVVVSVLGYFTIQIGGSQSSSKMMRLVNTLAGDLQETGMHKVVAGMNPAPPAYFEAADILGLLYHNRLLLGRLENYPPFVVMGQRPQWKEIGSDRALQQSLQSELNIMEILQNPKVQAVVTNLEIYKELISVDLKDLRAYLETGRSPQYDPERILGRWQYDFPASFKLFRQNKTVMMSIAVSEFAQQKLDLEKRYEGGILQATCDAKISFQLPPGIEGSRIPELTNAPPRTSARGDWQRAGQNYRVNLDRGGRRQSSTATIRDRQLTLTLDGRQLSFVKITP